MMKLLEPLQGKDIYNFVDGLLIAIQTWEEHLEALRAIFMRLRETNLRAGPTKCFVCFKRLDFLGHTLSHETLNEGKLSSCKTLLKQNKTH